MNRTYLASLPWFLLVACSSSAPDKYVDTHNLEFPPTLVIEHTTTNSSIYRANLPDNIPNTKVASASAEVNPSSNLQSTEKSTNDTDKPVKPANEADKPVKPELSKLILLVGSEKKPTLELKTGFDRAWILVADALSAAGIEVADINRDAGVFKVRFVADGEGSGRGLFSSVTSFFSDQFEDTEYTLTVDKDKRVTDVRVDKVLSADSKKETFNKDDSAALIKLLHKTIIADLDK
jgi:uncharacterized lipoprotein